MCKNDICAHDVLHRCTSMIWGILTYSQIIQNAECAFTNCFSFENLAAFVREIIHISYDLWIYPINAPQNHICGPEPVSLWNRLCALLNPKYNYKPEHVYLWQTLHEFITFETDLASYNNLYTAMWLFPLFNANKTKLSLPPSQWYYIHVYVSDRWSECISQLEQSATTWSAASFDHTVGSGHPYRKPNIVFPCFKFYKKHIIDATKYEW